MHVPTFSNLLVSKSRSFLVKDSGIDQRIEETIVQAILGMHKLQGPKQQGLMELCSREVPIRHLCSPVRPFVRVSVQHSVSKGIIWLAFLYSVVHVSTALRFLVMSIRGFYAVSPPATLLPGWQGVCPWA